MSRITQEELERLIRDRLEIFFNHRSQILENLNLWDTLKRKNPYLFKAMGIQEASEIVRELLQAYISSSDEGIFGEDFFEPIAKAVGGGVDPDYEMIGIDAIIEKPDEHIAVQVKSGPYWGNADQRRKLNENFIEARETFSQRGISKQFRALLGQCSGRSKGNPTDKKIYFTLSGQAFWKELTGDPDFYLKLIRLMKDYPDQYRPDYVAAWNKAHNRFTREFLNYFSTPSGEIDWEKIVQLNSGEKLLKKSEANNQQLDLELDSH